MNADTSAASAALTHDDLARETGVSVTTIKSYRRKFPGFIPVAGFGKPIRFEPEALAVCSRIRTCFAEGLSVRETRKRLEQDGYAPDAGSIPPPQPGSAGPDGERLEEFLKVAGEMMRAVSGLAEAQKETDERLARLEEGLSRLATMEAENKALLARLGPVAASEPEAEPEAAGPAPEPEPSRPKRMKATKIVNVRTAAGQVDSYALGDEPDMPAPAEEGAPPAPAVEAPDEDYPAPPPDLLDRPVAIRSEEGEYLGLPGRLTLRELAAFLLERGQARGEVGAVWLADGNGWRFHLDYEDGRQRGLTFMSQTTPTGVRLALLTRLILDGVEVSSEKRMEYFRQVKDLQQRR